MRFPEFTGEWKEYKVSDILEFFPTNSLSWEQLEFETDNIHNLHYGLIHKGLPTQIELDKCTLPNIKDEFIPNKYTICKDGDVAFADASEDTNDVAKAIEFLNCNNKCIVCGLHTIHGRDKKHLTIKGFKGYAFSSIPFRNQVRRLAQGTKIYSINSKNFDELYIGIPSKEEQAKIAHLLLLIDERIETQNKIIEKLESLIKGLDNLLFCNRKSKPALRFPEYLESWRKSTLKEFTSRVTRKNKDNETQRALTIAAQYGLVDQISFFNKQVASNDMSNYYLLYNGEFAYNKSYSKDYPWGAVKRLDSHEKGALSTLYICFKPLDNVNSDYLVHYFESNKWYQAISEIAGEGARNHGLLNISIDAYFNTMHYIPSYEEQNRIASFLNILCMRLENEKATLCVFEKQKLYFLRQMFI
ncbi:restriction endonuclease subunit S [Dysgonomonas sp. 216]|uniref:restriction endonuclease subunit S n=1 Tax=Dysgonomonas sp. 216 TaxID=2302934 RepID=UPI0013D32711|nr:restriction endonuclease subunit S [Dysgonomonas sp. 216]NDW18269.1 restriction endonuclease subunit S [Dysgonomonas sp. 216]NDW18637.1 restriction endonuclease subunit S [Dysgonomonas sp. 216]